MNINFSKKQIQPLVTKFNINPETNVVFQNIIKMFDGQIPYQIWAIKLVFGNVIGFETLQLIKNFADANQTLISKLSKQNIILYKTKDDIALLLEEINGLLSISNVKRVIEKFNTDQKVMLKKYAFGDNEDVSPLYATRSTKFREFANLCQKFNGLPDVVKNNVIRVLSACRNIETLVEKIKLSLDETYSWDKKDVLDFIKRDKRCKNVNVIYDNDNILILEIPTFEASSALAFGRTSWCLSRESSYFNQYVSGNQGNKQYFYFDFSKNEENDVAHVGITINKSGGIVYAHSTQNHNMVSNSVMIGGHKQVNIQQLLEMNNIPTTVFVHLNGLGGYFEWNIQSVVKYIQSKPSDYELTYCQDNRIIVRIKSSSAFDKLFHNTLVISGNLTFNSSSGYSGRQGEVYGILDFNHKQNDDNCMITLQYNKDLYGTLERRKVMDAFSKDITSTNYFKNIGLNIDKIIQPNEIPLNVLLHKYLNNKDEAKALELLNSGNSEIDINYVFNDCTPIFTAINNNMFEVFKVIVSNKNFKCDTKDPFQEPLLQSLMYRYRQDVSENSSAVTHSPSRKMIEVILSTDGYNFNDINFNMDSPIMTAVESTDTNWVFDELLKKPNIDMTLLNDENRSVLGNAIFFKNHHAINELCKRDDVKVTDRDYDLAKKNGIDLNSIIERCKNARVGQATEEVKKPTDGELDIDEYASKFASLFYKVHQ